MTDIDFSYEHKHKIQETLFTPSIPAFQVKVECVVF